MIGKEKEKKQIIAIVSSNFFIEIMVLKSTSKKDELNQRDTRGPTPQPLRLVIVMEVI